MEQNAKNIDELRLKVESKHQSVLTEKEIEARAKGQQLKGKSICSRSFRLVTIGFFAAYEERLQLQAADFERERKNLQELIARLEVHLSEQTKLVEEVSDRPFVGVAHRPFRNVGKLFKLRNGWKRCKTR